MFGFTIGADVLEKGKLEVSNETIAFLGKRGRRYRVGSSKTAFAFAPVEGLSIQLGATGHSYSIRNVPGFDNRSFSGFGGVSTEVKWQLLRRDRSPFGLTLLAEPRLVFLEAESGERGRGRGVETRLLFDTALIPDTLFAGFNVLYDAENFRPRGLSLFSAEGEELEAPLAPCGAPAPKVNHAHADTIGEDAVAAEGLNTADANEAQEPCTALARRKAAERSSKFGFSGALAVQAIPNVFLGAEVRYLRAYEGLALQDFRGEAVFIGPTLYTKLNERLGLSAAFSTQIAGRAAGVPGRLDLDNFPRHQGKLKITYEF